MPAPDRDLPPRDAASRIVETLRRAGHTAYFAGGCVRDELLGRTPDDYDVATDATPERVMTLFPRSGEVGKSFGVVLVQAPGSRHVVEVATFRSDGQYTDSRRPDSVRFSTPEEDAARRDFTVNALFLDPITGNILDFVGGQADLAARLLRAVGRPEARLAEDHLRALRAVRLAAKLAFTIEPATAHAIRTHAKDLRGVSRERVGDEIERMLTNPARARAAALLRDLNLEPPVLDWTGRQASGPSLAALPPHASYIAALAAWALDLGLEPGDAPREALVTSWRQSLCLSNEHRDGLAAVLAGVEVLRGPWPAAGVAAQKRLAAKREFETILTVLYTLDLPRAESTRSRVRELALTPSGIAPPPFLTGDDLISLGLKPGPAFRRILDAVYDAQLEDRVQTFEQARELAGSLSVKAG
ncbi:MAG: CCA tRNA nucleotidyltransferase [Tepidisphaera sp.]|nr:CCA tRNA nucleotidyltransferase [Tepidisphaera sp.]